MPYITIPTDQYFAIVSEQLAAKGQAFVRVTGISMSPLLRHLQDRVLIVPAAHIRRGDIVLYDRRNGRYALHRIISVRDDSFSMMGDNQWHLETGLHVHQIIGKVACVYRGQRQLSADSFGMRIYAIGAVVMAYIKWPIAQLRKVLSSIIHRQQGVGP